MKRYIYCMAIVAMVLYSCNNASKDSIQNTPLEDQTTTQNNNDVGKTEEKNIAADSTAGPLNNSPVITTNNQDWNKKIIKTANMELELDDYKKFNSSFHNSLKQFGAYIANEKQQLTNSKMESTITIKVPVAQFDDLVNSVSGDGIKIINKDITGEDVTGEVVDTKARLQAKLAVREKYLSLLKEAKNMNDIITVQNEINDIQENIEAADGRINYLQHSAAYSTINIDYYQFINGAGLNDDDPGFFKKFSNAFASGASALGELLLFLISIWPFLLAIVIFWFFVKRFKLKKA